jgi:hypothetical protein
MARKHQNTRKPEQVTEQPATVEQVITTAPVTEQPAPKAKKLKYAPVQTIANTAAVLLWVKPNTKKGASRARYDRYYVGKEGSTVAQILQAYSDHNEKSFGRIDLRWDIEHQNIGIGLPKVAQQEKANEPTE